MKKEKPKFMRLDPDNHEKLRTKSYKERTSIRKLGNQILRMGLAEEE